MKKQNRRKKANRRSGRRTPQDLVIQEHPLSGRPRDEIIPELIEAAKASSIRFEEALKRTLVVLSTTEPLDVISAFAFYGCFAGIKLDGKVTPLMGSFQFGQAGAELAQALCLRLPLEKYGREPLDPPTFQTLFDVI